MRCAAHTNNLEVDQHGNAKPCCIFRGTWGNIQQLDQLEQTKQKFINNFSRSNQECQQCWEHEDLGFESKRQQFNHLIDEIEYTVLPPPKILEIKFSNLCNLACTTCGPFASSTWGTKLKIIEIENKFNKQGQQRVDYYLQLIQKHGYNKLNLIGGEPTMDPHCQLLLDRLIELDLSKNIDIGLITNGQDISEFVSKYVDKFREMQISLSIDGMDSVYEYMRNPGTWMNILKTLSNLGAIQKRLRRPEQMRVGITYTFSVLNQYHYGDFKRWVEQESHLYCNIIGLHANRVDFPRELEPRVYNEAMLEDLDEDLRSAVKIYKFEANQRPLKDALDLDRDRPRGVSWATAGLDERDLENIEYIIYDERRHHGRLESD